MINNNTKSINRKIIDNMIISNSSLQNYNNKIKKIKSFMIDKNQNKLFGIYHLNSERNNYEKRFKIIRDKKINL